MGTARLGALFNDLSILRPPPEVCAVLVSTQFARVPDNGIACDPDRDIGITVAERPRPSRPGRIDWFYHRVVLRYRRSCDHFLARVRMEHSAS